MLARTAGRGTFARLCFTESEVKLRMTLASLHSFLLLRPVTLVASSPVQAVNILLLSLFRLYALTAAAVLMNKGVMLAVTDGRCLVLFVALFLCVLCRKVCFSMKFIQMEICHPITVSPECKTAKD